MGNKTRIHPETGEKLHRDVRPLTVMYKGLSETIEMGGWYPDGEGDAVYSFKDLKPFDEAMKRLKAKHREAEGKS